MTHTDKLVKGLEFSHEGVFDFKEFLSLIKDLFDRYDFDFDETKYKTKTSDELKTTKIEWEFDRKYDDYNRGYIYTTIELSDYKESYVDGNKVVDGKLTVSIDAEMKRDYEERWKTAPSKRFLRALYEKFVSAEKQSSVDKKLKDAVKSLMNEIKQYFKS